MKKISLIAALALVLAILPLATLRADSGSWNGWITDESCGAKGANAAHADCAKACLAKGGKLVFYNEADKKLYKLDKQDVAKQHIGHEVTVKGEAKGDAIAVASIEPTPAK
ncbi:MAG TPA: DUF5818 domain-containing protein [Thermoanaerobaculia bacterium]|nr:DUF5818 domain-containing protein [Thermoanaerobaculia bacterium]